MNIYDISQKAGVSIATVSRVLNHSDHVSQATRDKVMAVIEESGYIPNAFARGLGLNSMKTIGLVCPDASDPYLAEAISLLERFFREKAYNCLLCCTGRGHQERMTGVLNLLGRHPDGLILMGSSFAESNDSECDYIHEAAKSVPVIMLNGQVSGEGIYHVSCDAQAYTYEAVKELISNGCRNILHFYHSQNQAGLQKLDGYRQALTEAGLPVLPELQHMVQSDNIPQAREELLTLMQNGLKFDAVVCSQDSLGISAVKAVRASGLRVPEDVQVIGCNNSSLCLCCEPELTSIDSRLHDLCACCVSTMMTVLEGSPADHQTIFSGKTIHRASTL